MRTPRAAVRAVLFDLDDTLFDHEHCAREALAGVQSRHACFRRLAFEQLEAAHAQLLEELHREVLAGRVNLDDARVERFRRLFRSVGVDADRTLARQAAAAYRERYLGVRQTIGGAAELLRAVRERARVGIVSNNLLREQLQKLRRCGLVALVDALVVSEEIGVSKPDPTIFCAALARLGCAPEEAVMIGDSWEADVRGARAAGIRPIWFNRRGVPRPEPAEDVGELVALKPLLAVLGVIFDTGS